MLMNWMMHMDLLLQISRIVMNLQQCDLFGLGEAACCLVAYCAQHPAYKFQE